MPDKKGLLDKIKAAEGQSGTATADQPVPAPADNGGGGLLGKIKAAEGQSPADVPRETAPVDQSAPQTPQLPQTMQSANGNGDNNALHDDIKFASDVIDKMLGPTTYDKNHQVDVVGKTAKGNPAVDTYKDGELNRTVPAGDNTPIVGGQIVKPTTPTPANIDAARQSIKSEIDASGNYLNKFITNNQSDLAKYPALSGNYTGQGPAIIDADGLTKKIVNPTGDKQSLANFSTTSLAMLDQKRKTDLANIENQYPVHSGGESGVVFRPNEKEYNTAVATTNKKYDEEKGNLVNAMTNIANIKVANEYINRKGVNAVITDKDYLQMGLDVAEAIGAPGIDKTKTYATDGRLSEAEKVYYQRIGGNALRYKTMQAAAEGQDAVAQALHNNNDHYERKILEANPGFRKEQVINAISDELYKQTGGSSNPEITPEKMVELAQKLNIDPKDLKDIKPEEIKREPNMLQSWIGGLNESAAHMYEFGIRHVLTPVFNHLGGADLTGNKITDEDLDKRYPSAWWDSRGIGGSILTGGPKPTASTMFGQSQTVNTDQNSNEYLQNIGNPDAGKFQPHINQFLHSSASMLGNLSGFVKGAGLLGKTAEGLNIVGDVQKAEKVGTAAMVVLQNHDENMKVARESIPGEGAAAEVKQATMGLLYTGLDIAAIEMFSPLDLKNKIFGGGNSVGNQILGILKKEGVEGLTYNNTGAKLVTKALKETGIDWSKMTGGMTAAQVGKVVTDYALAPDKYKNENPGDEIAQVAITNAIMNIIPSVAAGVGAAKNEGDLKKMLPFEVGSNPRQYLDGIDKMLQLGKIDQATADQKKATVNTLADVVGKTPVQSIESGNGLNDNQRAAYANSLFKEEIANQQKANTKDKVLEGQLDSYIKKEQGTRKDIMKEVDTPPVTPEPKLKGTKTANNETPTQVVGQGDEEAQKAQSEKDVLMQNSGTQDKGGNEAVTSPAPELKKSEVKVEPNFKVGGKSGTNNMHPWAVEVGNDINDALGGDVTFNSVHRSDANNKAVGGVANSYHTLGAAIDIKPADWERLPEAKQQEILKKFNAKVIDETADKNHYHIEPIDRTVLSKFKKQVPAVAAEPKAGGNNITIGEMVDNPQPEVMYKGERATLYRDGQTVIARIHNGDREYELGNVEDIQDHSIGDYGMEPQNNVVSSNEKGNFTVRGKEYENRYSDPLAAINYGEDGDRVSVTLHTPDGKPRTFKGDVGEDLAYQIHLKEITKRNETGELEQFINSDPAVRDDIELAKHDNGQHTAPEVVDKGPQPSADITAAASPKEVPRKKIQRDEQPVEDKQTKLFHKVDPAFDFEAEPEHKPVVVAADQAEPHVAPAEPGTPPAGQAQGDIFKQEDTPAGPAANNSEKAPAVASSGNEKAEFFTKPRSEKEVAESAKVGDNIKEKFNNAEKVVGNRTARVLENGEKIPGHYVMVDAFGITPSNDPNSMRMSEGFPTLEDGRNPNDRDYTQTSNEANVRKRAGDYDGRALQNIPTVDKNGVVIDGNDRTMSGQLAAATGKDGKYYQTLKEKAADYGFTPEQVKDMKARSKNPRVVFVPDAIEPYTTETFSKFNPKTVGKVKTAIEEAIQYGRTAPQKLIDALGRQMSGYDKVSEFFADKPAVKNAIDLLEAHGIINSDNKNAYFNPKERTFTPEGKELLQNIMLGKTFDEENLRLLQNHPDMREKMLFAMNNIMAIEAKGPEYTLKEHISDALHLWDKVEQYRENVAQLEATPEGREKAYEQYMAQQDMFDAGTSPEAKIIYADMNSRRKSSLRELTKSYLHAANEHGKGEDMFGNLPPKREELLQQYFLNKENERQLLESARKVAGEGIDGRPAVEGQRPEQQSEQTSVGTEAPQPETAKPESSGPGTTPEPDLTGNALFEPVTPYEKPAPSVPAVAEPGKPQHISDILAKKPSERTPEEKHAVYLNDKSNFEKYDELVKKKQERVTDLRNQLEELDRVNNSGTEEFSNLKRNLQGNERTLSDAKQQRALAAGEIKKYEGKRAGDALREWAQTNLADNLTYSSPFAFVPKTVKSLLDLVAKGLDAGWNLRHAIRRAIAEHKVSDPEFNKLMEQHPDNENITSNWLHSEAVGKVNDRESAVKPDIGSAKNKQLADAIISRIKNNDITLEAATDKIYENPNIPDETKLKIIDYLEHNTANEEKLIRDRNNANFLDDYKSQASNELRQFSSGATMEDVFGTNAQGDQSYMTDKLHLMLDDAEKMISLAQYHWGDNIVDYGPKLLDYVNKMSRDDGPKKGSLLATYLGKLHEARLRGEDNSGTINNLLGSAEQSWQKYINQVGKELNTGRLLRIYRDKNMSEFFTDKILSEKEQGARERMQQALTTEKISDKVAEQGVLRDQAEVIAEEKQRSDIRAKDEAAASDKATKRKERAAELKKDLKEKTTGKADELFAEKAAQKLREIKDPNKLMDEIKEQIKKIKC